MAKKNVEALESALGVLTSLTSQLVKGVKANGGSVRDIHRLVTPEGEEIMNEVARIVAGKKRKRDNTLPEQPVICTPESRFARVIGKFSVNVRSDTIEALTAGSSVEIDETVASFIPGHKRTCLPEYAGTKNVCVIIFDAKAPTYLELGNVLDKMGYRRACELELICLAAQHDEALRSIIMDGTDLVTGQMSSGGDHVVVHKNDSGSIVLMDRMNDHPDLPAGMYIAVVKK